MYGETYFQRLTNIEKRREEQIMKTKFDTSKREYLNKAKELSGLAQSFAQGLENGDLSFINLHSLVIQSQQLLDRMQKDTYMVDLRDNPELRSVVSPFRLNN